MAAEEGQVVSCHTLDAWNEQLQKGNDSKKLMVIDFTASWCGPCRFIAPFLAELAKKLPNVIFVKVDVDELKSVAQDWAVEAMPTFMFLKEGKIVGQSGGSKERRAAADYSKARCCCFCFCLITYDIICIICLFILRLYM
ncbi:hypothetical protein L3X38_039380 [Prunus dulcis]|uniref:Thioredoxin domain-containing protein n=1 Tax=Prunus dulcis TaxID=3755 RepID=A0AAD4YRE2_PRUDU|nr:hypothetical protein L3X38_039380 [Prunus dulcis]